MSGTSTRRPRRSAQQRGRRGDSPVRAAPSGMTGISDVPGIPGVDLLPVPSARSLQPRAQGQGRRRGGRRPPAARPVPRPIFIPAPPRYPKGPDGQGWNRLRVESIWGDECGLKPRSPAKLWETRNRPPAYGGYGPCPVGGACGTCPVLNAPRRQLLARTGRVLVRIDPDDWGVLRLAEAASSEPDHPGEVWSWTQLARLDGWEPGCHGRDDEGEWFWLQQEPGTPAAGD